MRQVALVDRFTEFLALPRSLHFAETNLALKGFSRQPAQILLILLLAARLACAQGGHPTPPPPPPGAKSIKCSGRPIPQLEDITAKTGITFKHTSDPSLPASSIPSLKAPESFRQAASVRILPPRPGLRRKLFRPPPHLPGKSAG